VSAGKTDVGPAKESDMKLKTSPFAGRSVLSLFAAALIADLAPAQIGTGATPPAPTFAYRASDKLTVHRTHDTRAQCWDWVSVAWVLHEDKRFMIPKQLVKIMGMTPLGGLLRYNYQELDRPTVSATHDRWPWECHAGTMSADAKRYGAARIDAKPTSIVMTTVESADDEVEVVGQGLCGGGGGIFPAVNGKARTWSSNTVESTTPFGLRECAVLRMDRLFSSVAAYKSGSAAVMSAEVYAQIEVFRDVNSNGTLDAGDVSAWSYQGQELGVQLGDPVMTKTSTEGPVTVALNPGRYLAVFTFHHLFEVETIGDFANTGVWEVSAGDSAAGSVRLSLLPCAQPGQ
jgi:hypothetical protein